jgi:nucleotide-binding universal stress UspA family protein
MFNKVLVPVDFTPKSDYSLAMASQIVTLSGGEIDLFHVVQAALAVRLNEAGEYESLGSSGQKFLSEILDSNKKKLNKLANKYQSDNCAINLRLKVDDIPDNVAEHIHEENYDLLIVGGHTDYKLHEAFGENHNEKIVKLAKKPVMVINKAPANTRLKKIVVPTNFKDDYGSQADVLKEVQSFFNAEIEFLYINTPAYFATTYELDEFVKAFQEKYNFENCSFRIMTDRDNKKGILAAIDYLQADMVCVLSFQSRRLNRFFRGDITEYLVNHCTIPVMVLNVQR